MEEENKKINLEDKDFQNKINIDKIDNQQKIKNGIDF